MLSLGSLQMNPLSLQARPLVKLLELAQILGLAQLALGLLTTIKPTHKPDQAAVGKAALVHLDLLLALEVETDTVLPPWLSPATAGSAQLQKLSQGSLVHPPTRGPGETPGT